MEWRISACQQCNFNGAAVFWSSFGEFYSLWLSRLAGASELPGDSYRHVQALRMTVVVFQVDS